MSAWTSRTCHQAASSSLRWWPSNLEFQSTSDKDFIGLKSSLEAEISVSNLPLYDLFVGERKKTCHFEMNFSFKVCWSQECYIIIWDCWRFSRITKTQPGAFSILTYMQGSQIRQIWRILRQNCSDDSTEVTEGVTLTSEIFGYKQEATSTPENNFR